MRDARTGDFLPFISRPCACCPRVAAVNDYGQIPGGWYRVSQRANENATVDTFVCSAQCLLIHVRRLSSFQPSVFHQ